MPPALTIDDVLAVEYPGAPDWSVDGRYVGVTVYEDDGQSLRVATPDGGHEGAWRVSPGAGHVAAFAWAPDPTPARLAVLTDEGGLFLCNAAHQTVERLSDHADTDDLAWSSRGRRLAFYRDGRPTVRDVEEGTVRRFDVPERGPFLGEDRMLAWGPDDRLLAYRFVDFDTKQVGVVDTDAGDLEWRTREQAFSTSTPQWLGDGRLLVDRSGERGTVREVVAVDVADGAEQVLYREENRETGTVSRGAPTVSPDGDRIALALPEDGWEHVHVVEVDTGERAQLTGGDFEDKGLADSRPRWRAPDELVFASNREDPGRRGIYAVDLDGRVRTLVPAEGTNVHPTPSPDGERLAYVHAGVDVSPEVRVVDLADEEGGGTDAAESESESETEFESGSEPRGLTRSRVADWPVDPVEPDLVTYESVGGREISAYLLDPRSTRAVPADAASLPAVVWVHGGPMRQMREGWHPSRSYGIAYTFHQFLARKGYVGLFVNYRGGIGYGTDFRQALAGHRGDHEIRDVVAGADFLRDLEYVDPGRIGMWGLSYGGYTALQVLGTHPEAFDCAVNLAGLADLERYRDWAEATKYPACASSMAVRLGGEPWEAPEAWAEASPATHFEDYEHPLYSFHGTNDSYVNFGQLDVAVEELVDLGKSHEWEHYPDETHVFSKRATWERVLEKVEAAFDEEL